MPSELIGECGDVDAADRERMVAEVDLGCKYVVLVCGEPPAGCKVGLMWHEHDLGSYATVGLCWNPSVRSDAPWEYISRAETAIFRFSTAVDWRPIPYDEDDDNDEPDDDEEDEDDESEDDEPEREDTGEPPLQVESST